MSKVFEMLASLQAKVQKEGEEAQKVYDEFSEWCKDRSQNIENEVKAGKAQVEELSAVIEKESAKMVSFENRIEELSGTIASNEADLRAATEIRKSESADFGESGQETLEIIRTLQRAVAVLKREQAKGDASLVQVKSVQEISQAMDALVKGSLLSSADATRLTALVQTSQSSESDDANSIASPTGYVSHSQGLVSTLEDLLDKAQEQLEGARRTETTRAHSYAMLKESLEDEMSAGNADMSDTKKKHAESQEARKAAEGALSTTQADLKEDTATLAALHQDCTTGSEDFVAETKSREDELKALAEARKILGNALPAAAQTYGPALDQASFLQVMRQNAGISSQEDLAKFEAVRFIRDLGRKQNSVALAQLASQLSSIFRYASTSGSHPYEKAKRLVSDMLAKLQKDAAADVSHKEFCDKEMSEATLKKDEKAHEINKLSTEVMSLSAKSAKLKEEVAALSKEVSELSSSQAEIIRIRSEETTLYTKNKAEMEAGISGVQQALSILRDYYAQESEGHSPTQGAGSGIIGLLEIVQADFTKGLAEMEVAESTAGKEFEKITGMNKDARSSKETSLKYKQKEAAALAKSATEVGSDKDTSQTELDAVLEYLAKLNKMCVGKAEPYAEKKARMDAEIAGLKEALAALEGGGMLLQESAKKKRRSFRGKSSSGHLRV